MEEGYIEVNPVGLPGTPGSTATGLRITYKFINSRETEGKAPMLCIILTEHGYNPDYSRVLYEYWKKPALYNRACTPFHFGD